jgi:hypothetical protein
MDNQIPNIELFRKLTVNIQAKFVQVGSVNADIITIESDEKISFTDIDEARSRYLHELERRRSFEGSFSPPRQNRLAIIPGSNSESETESESSRSYKSSIDQSGTSAGHVDMIIGQSTDGKLQDGGDDSHPNSEAEDESLTDSVSERDTDTEEEDSESNDEQSESEDDRSESSLHSRGNSSDAETDSPAESESVESESIAEEDMVLRYRSNARKGIDLIWFRWTCSENQQWADYWAKLEAESRSSASSATASNTEKDEDSSRYESEQTRHDGDESDAYSLDSIENSNDVTSVSIDSDASQKGDAFHRLRVASRRSNASRIGLALVILFLYDVLSICFQNRIV